MRWSENPNCERQLESMKGVFGFPEDLIMVVLWLCFSNIQ